VTYQEKVMTIWRANGGATPDARLNMALGLASEAGEVCDVIRTQTWKHRVKSNNLKEELGDVLFFVAAISAEYGYTIEDIQDANLEKLKARYGK